MTEYLSNLILILNDSYFTDTMLGPAGLYAACWSGVLHVMHGDPSGTMDFVPVDTVSNVLITAGWYATTQQEMVADRMGMGAGEEGPVVVRDYCFVIRHHMTEYFTNLMLLLNDSLFFRCTCRRRCEIQSSGTPQRRCLAFCRIKKNIHSGRSLKIGVAEGRFSSTG